MLFSTLCHSRFAILMGKRAGYFTLTVFLILVTFKVLCLFLMILWVGLQCVIVVFPAQFHLLCSVLYLVSYL